MLVAQPQAHHPRSPFPGLGPRPGYSAGAARALRPALARSRGSSDSFTACSAVTRFSDECLVIPPIGSGQGAVRLAGAGNARRAASGSRAAAEAPGPSIPGPKPASQGFSSSPSSAPASALLTVQPSLHLTDSGIIVRDYVTLLPSRPPSSSAVRQPEMLSAPSGSGTSRPTRPSPPLSPPMGSSLLQRRSSRSAGGARPNMSLITNLAPVSLPLPLPLPLGQIELDDTVRPEVVGVAAAADTPVSESASPMYPPTMGTPLEVPYLPTKKFVSTPYPEKKGWLEEDDEEDEEEVDSQKGVKYVASDEESEGEEEDDYFESEKQRLEKSTEALSPKGV